MNVTKRMFVKSPSKVPGLFGFFLLSFEELCTGGLSDKIIPVDMTTSIWCVRLLI